MPLHSNWNIQWENQNAGRAYPLAAETTRVDQTGGFTLPDDFLIELDLPVHAGMDVDPARFYVRYVGAFATGYSIVVAYQPADDSAPVNAATALISRQAQGRNTVYNLGGVAPFQDTSGKVTIGKLDSIDRQPPGMWEFTFDAARLTPDAIRPLIRGVSSLVCVSGTQSSMPLVGVVELVAGSNCRLDVSLSGPSGPRVTVNFLGGEGTVDSCVCEGDSAPSTPITQIDGVSGTPSGAFYIVGSDCVSVTPIANGIRIGDSCSQPCCSCAELERITSDLATLHAQSNATAVFVDRLQAASDTMSLTVLGAKLGDRGCIQC